MRALRYLSLDECLKTYAFSRRRKLLFWDVVPGALSQEDPHGLYKPASSGSTTYSLLSAEKTSCHFLLC